VYSVSRYGDLHFRVLRRLGPTLGRSQPANHDRNVTDVEGGAQDRNAPGVMENDRANPTFWSGGVWRQVG
jgi:hypothetical protein